jgi:hypothetical protein
MTRLCKIEVTLSRFLGSGGCAVVVVSMSKQEFSRLDVLLRVQSGRLRVTDACVLIGLQRRQVFRLLLNETHKCVSRSSDPKPAKPEPNRII